MIEDIINSLKTILQANLPAKLDLIEAARPGITLPDPKAIYVVGPPPEKPVQFPFIVLDSFGSDAEKFPNQVRGFSHKIRVAAYHRDFDDEKRERILWRYGEAIEKIWKADVTIGGKADSSNLVSWDYDYIQDLDKGEIVAKGIMITLEAHEKIQ